ncbi:MAG TPA: hypothetical protein VGP44_08110 [Gemmatimonadales bacterium]|nr:hypothetical protein [Gemmatimonadales bacterium]
MTIEPFGGDWGDQHVLSLIGRGRDTARTIGDLAETLNRPRRSVEQTIQRLRVDGWAISSGSEGIWLADLEDIHRTIDSLARRILQQRATLRALRDTEKRMQRALFPAEQLVAWLDIA